METTSEPARREVTPLELFFDLVFVFAIGQLSHQLLAHPTWTGAAQTLVLYLAVYAAWAYTTWAVTLVPAEDPRTRRMLLAVMFVGLFMNATIPRAFDDAGWVFAATFLLIHLGRTVWLLRVGLDRVNQEHFGRVLIWFAAAAPLWLIGAAAGGGARLAWWAAATVVELAGTWTAHPLPGRRLDSRQVTFAGGHLLERGRLFMIIAFGETILTTGTALTTAPYAPMTLLTSSVALAGTIALFWLFFSRSERMVAHYQQTEDPIRAGRSGVLSLMVSVAGMIAAAVADERVIAHPVDHAGITTNLLLFGGPAVFIATQTWHGATLFDDLRWSRAVALLALVAGGLVTPAVPAYLSAAIAAVIVIALVAFEHGRPHTLSLPEHQEHPMTQHSMFAITTVAPKIRRVTFSNPPVNVVGADTVTQLLAVVDELSADEQVQVVIFDSGTPGYFFNHADLGQVPDLLALNAADGTPMWVELVTRLTGASFVSIASIRGRTRGGGDEITLAFDLRYASREEAIFCQPEVAIGIVPGGGGSDRLARLLGRDRALEVILTSEDFDAERAEQYGWVTRAVPDAELDGFVNGVAARIASFGKASVLGAKAQINRSTLPPVADLRASWAEFAESVTWPGFQARVPQLGKAIAEIGLDEIERNLGHYAGVINQRP